jgi:hypothetical protein
MTISAVLDEKANRTHFVNDGSLYLRHSEVSDMPVAIGFVVRKVLIEFKLDSIVRSKEMLQFIPHFFRWSTSDMYDDLSIYHVVFYR